jgi:hypothetical protein
MSHDAMLNKPIIEILARHPDIIDVLDVGAGRGSWGHTIRAGLGRKVKMLAIEKWPDNCDILEATGLYTHIINDDALNMAKYYGPGSIDVVLASQVIEHLDGDDGHKLIDVMKGVASRLVIITTPLGFMPVTAENNLNPFERHLSGWNEADFWARGFDTQVLDMRPLTRSIKLVDNVRRRLFGLYDPRQIIATWSPR